MQNKYFRYKSCKVCKRYPHFSWISLASLLMLLTLSACAKEQNYRGVPEHQWKHLSGEAKQLIIDKAYQDEIQNNKSIANKTCVK